MKLTVTRGGGLAGFVTLTEVASSDLSPDDAAEFRRLVEDAGGLVLQEEAPPSRPDEPSYELSLEHHGRTRTVRLGESTMPAAIRALASWAFEVPGAVTRLVPSSGQR